MSTAAEVAAAMYREAARVETKPLEDRVNALEADNRMLIAAVARLVAERGEDVVYEDYGEEAPDGN
jgi:hypothetical protein